MAESWPASLEEKLNASGFNYSFANTTIRSDSEVGPSKVRRLYTTGVDRQTCSLRLHRDDYPTFENFFKTTLNGGVNTFLFNNPITDESNEWRFTGPPSFNTIGGNEFIINMEWERVLE